MSVFHVSHELPQSQIYVVLEDPKLSGQLLTQNKGAEKRLLHASTFTMHLLLDNYS